MSDAIIEGTAANGETLSVKPLHHVPSQKEIRYDRQLRLWGDNGQTALEKAHVCLINASATGTEILKSLILPGIGKFTIIDEKKVTGEDVGNNFFLEKSGIGKPRGLMACDLLTELNPDVKGEWLNVSPGKLLDGSSSMLNVFTLVIATELQEKSTLRIGQFLWDRKIPFIVARSYGLVGYIRLVAPEHPIIEAHPENPFPDLRLCSPFDSLKTYVDSVDLDRMNHQEHSHTPYLVLLMKAIEKWKSDKDSKDAFPEKYADKKAIKEILANMQKPDDKGRMDDENFHEAITAVNTSVVRLRIPNKVKEVLAEAQKRNLKKVTDCADFFILCKALRRFIEDTGTLPVRGSLPDMTADSSRYLQLQNIFHAKATEDADKLEEYAVEIGKSIGTPCPPKVTIQKFCRNAPFLRLIKGRDLFSELSKDTARVDCIRQAFQNQDRLMTWYILFRATERFCSEKGRYPGTNGIPVELDDKDLRNRVKILGEELGISELIATNVSDEMVTEMCRYGAAELHPVASFIGGIAAQEAIKVITSQYVPLNNTFIFDGNTSSGATFEL